MTGETDNLSAEGTDNAMPEQSDTAMEWDYYDPDEDTVEEQEAATDDGDSSEPEEPETEEEQAEDEADGEGEEPDEEAEPEALFDVDGEQVTRDELVKGYQRQQDYTRKTQALSNERNEFKAEVQRLDGVTNALIDGLTAMMPQPPDPALARQNPGEYLAQKDRYERAVQYMQDLVAKGSEVAQVKDSLSEADRNKTIQSENQALMEAFPEISDPKKRETFLVGTQEAAMEAGFTPEDMSQILDHRYYKVLHWAKKGLDAEKATKTAKEKVAKAPPAPPRKAAKGKSATGNREAMRKLSQSGSIRDAMAVDWD